MSSKPDPAYTFDRFTVKCYDRQNNSYTVEQYDQTRYGAPLLPFVSLTGPNDRSEYITSAWQVV